MFFLGRCYAGDCFVDPRFNYPADDETADMYVNKSMERGSAVGMFGARRFGGLKPVGGTFIHAPYTSDREIWDAVADLALEGETFCELLIANAYYYGDVIGFLGLNVDDMPESKVASILRTFILTAMDMYEDIFNKGMLMGYGNYKDIITSGGFGIKPDKNKYKWLQKVCATKDISI